MNGERIQKKVLKGYSIAAKNLGTNFNLYRSSSLMNPTADFNKIDIVKASFVTKLDYKNYSKPKDPFFIAVLDDGKTLDKIQTGDWLADELKTYFIAEIQRIVPIAAIECNSVVSIMRPGYGTSLSGGYEASDVQIAVNLPIFRLAKSNSSSAPKWFPAATTTVAPLAEWVLYINARNVDSIKAQDIVIDENGIRYQVETAQLTGFGFIATAKLEAP